ncbi:MAG: hypothetical protein IJN05_08250 [Ruminococcus sp.]|nr:hypothetical protein [Ruminococcus sp.]
MANLQQIISNLDSITFEKFGYVFSDIITGLKLKHRGLNTNNQPVKSTVDAFSDNGEIVFEFSVDKRYFDVFDKADNDVEHAVSNHPQVKSIYLVTNNEASPLQGTNFANHIKQLEQSYNVTIYWYDSRQIAEYIENTLISEPLCLQRFISVVPEIPKLFSSKLQHLHFPKTPENYYYDISTSYKIISTKKALYIHGISGAGKTTLALKLKDELANNTLISDVCMVDAKNIHSNNDLCHATVNDEYNTNLLSVIESKPHTLTIIDNLSIDEEGITEELFTLLNSSSYLIITSQLECRFANTNGFSFLCVSPTDEQAEKILNYKIPKDQKCPDNLQSSIFQKTSKNPYVLEIIRRFVWIDDLSWGDIETQLNEISSIETPDHTTICKKIIGNHFDALCKEIAILKLLHTQKISKSLLKKLIGTQGVEKLRRRSLILINDEIVILHDIVFNAVTSIEIDLLQYKNNFITSFYSYYLTTSELKTKEFYVALHLHARLIKELFSEDKTSSEKGYLYLLAFPDDNFKLVDSIDIMNYSIDSSMTQLQLKFIIELIEYNYKRDKAVLIESDFANKIKNYVALFSRLANILDDKLIQHHLGKFYIYTNNYDEAKTIFEHLVHIGYSYKSKFQLIRVYQHLKINTDMTYEMIKEIITAYRNDVNSISLSLVLDTYSELSRTHNNELKKELLFDDFDTVRLAITAAQANTYDHPYMVLSNIADYYTYEYPDKLITIAEAIDIITVASVKKKNYFTIAQLYKKIGKAFMNKGDIDRAESYFSQAESIYSRIEQFKKAYEVTQRAENIELLQKYEEAISFMLSFEHLCCNDYFWNYRLAKSYFGPSLLDKAIYYIDETIRIGSQDQSKTKYIASAYHLKAQILIQQNADKDEILFYFENAIRKVENEKYKAQLIAECEAYEL